MAARRIHRLSAASLAYLGPGRHADGGGLYLKVTPSGARAWVFRYRVSGRLREHGLGALHTVSLRLARGKALELRRARLNGIDPLDQRKADAEARRLEAARSLTFEQAAEQYIAANRAGWRGQASEHQWRQSLADYVFPVIGSLPVQTIDTALVMKVLEPIWSSKTETASRVRSRIEIVLDWATARGFRNGENPARWRGHLANLLPKPTKVKRIQHHAALPYTEIAHFMSTLRQQGGVAARALEFMILSAARAGEVRGARWDEINERVWTIPAQRTKNGKVHRIPLSDAAMAVLQEMKGSSDDLVFPGTAPGRPVAQITVAGALRRAGGGDATMHGFRSTFRDWAAEQSSLPAEIAEMSLGHTVGGAVERAYRRSDLFAKRRQLMESWAAFIGKTGALRVIAA